MSNRKAMITHLIVGLIKKILLYKNDFFPPYSCIKNKIKVQLDLNAKLNEIKSEIHSITTLPTKASFNAQINEVESKIPSITNLAANAALTTVENKMYNNLVND